MKPRLKAQPLTFEDVSIRMTVDARFNAVHGPVPEWPSFSWILSDRRDADLMLALTGPRSDSMERGRGICTAELFVRGCVINNWAVGTRVAIRAYQFGPPRDDITYFA